MLFRTLSTNGFTLRSLKVHWNIHIDLCYLSGTGKTVIAGDAEYFNELQAMEPTADDADVLYE